MATIGLCLETVFTDLPVEERIGKIAEAGFRCVEFWHPEGTWDGHGIQFSLPKQAEPIRRACERHGVTLNDIVVNAWDGSIGGLPVRRQDRERYLKQVRDTIAFAEKVGCRKAITLTGTVDPALTRSEMRKNLEDAFAEAARIAEKADFLLVLEPLNTLVDHPGFYLDSSREAFEIVRTIGNPHLKVLYDVYHMQIMEGNVLATIKENLSWIGHFHAAGVPGRAELFGGELDYAYIVAQLDAMGYDGVFGLEYFPKISDHSQSLRKTLAYLSGRSLA